MEVYKYSSIVWLVWCNLLLANLVNSIHKIPHTIHTCVHYTYNIYLVSIYININKVDCWTVWSDYHLMGYPTRILYRTLSSSIHLASRSLHYIN